MNPIDREDREDQIITGLIRGKLQKEIAWELGIGRDAVTFYLRRLFRELNIHSIEELLNVVWSNRDSETPKKYFCFFYHRLGQRFLDACGKLAASWKPKGFVGEMVVIFSAAGCVSGREFASIYESAKCECESNRLEVYFEKPRRPAPLSRSERIRRFPMPS